MVFNSVASKRFFYKNIFHIESTFLFTYARNLFLIINLHTLALVASLPVIPMW